ncbi:MAG: hypothetical protein KAT20_00325, partial [Desulfuromonadales bacterium]|nr:hypothetical protein [Desulfuromonadales bacterium]
IFFANLRKMLKLFSINAKPYFVAKKNSDFSQKANETKQLTIKTIFYSHQKPSSIEQNHFADLRKTPFTRKTHKPVTHCNHKANIFFAVGMLVAIRGECKIILTAGGVPWQHVPTLITLKNSVM